MMAMVMTTMVMMTTIVIIVSEQDSAMWVGVVHVVVVRVELVISGLLVGGRELG